MRVHSGAQRRCPYCGGPLIDVRLGVRLSPLKARIFDLVQRAGRDGISGADLHELAYAGDRWDGRRPAAATIKVHIHQINEALEDTGYRILGRGTYRLVRGRK
jgi:hypothetical protein